MWTILKGVWLCVVIAAVIAYITVYYMTGFGLPVGIFVTSVFVLLLPLIEHVAYWIFDLSATRRYSFFG